MPDLKSLLAAIASFAALAGPAQAAPFSYDCDTGAGRFSELKQVQPGPDYRISGRISANELATHKRWAPGANLTIESADKSVRASLRILAPTRKAPLDVVLETTKDGKTETQTLGRIGLSQDLAFVLAVAGGQVRAEIGSMRGDAPISIGAGGSVSTVCSTGNFHFEDLRFEQ
ncbi:MAG TPA: hypothetical protein VIT45_12015 [Allosphingosinicella sp.]